MAQFINKIGQIMLKITDANNKVWLFISGCLAFLLVFFISADVIGRYVFSQPIPSSTEIAETILMLAVFLGFASTHAAGRNIRVDAVTRNLSHRWQTILEIFSCCGGLLLFSLIVYQSWSIGWQSWQEREFLMGALKVPAYISRLAVPVGGFFLCIEFLREIIYKCVQLLMR